MGTFDKSVGPSNLYTITFVAEGSISPNDLVALSSVNQWACKSNTVGNSKQILGTCAKVSVASVSAGEDCPVRIHGVTQVIAANGSIAAGDYLRADDTTPTRVTTIAAGGAGSSNIVGKALAASNAAGDVITMLLLNIPGATVS